jgi:hypothetical protein
LCALGKDATPARAQLRPNINLLFLDLIERYETEQERAQWQCGRASLISAPYWPSSVAEAMTVSIIRNSIVTWQRRVGRTTAPPGTLGHDCT